MARDKVPNADLRARALEIMEKEGKPLTPIGTAGRGRPSQHYRSPDGKTVLVRTGNFPTLPVRTDDPDLDKVGTRLDIDGADLILFVTPERPCTLGPVVAWLFPHKVAKEALQRGRREWLKTNPRTAGDNRTPVLRFDDPEIRKAFEKYRLKSTVVIKPISPMGKALIEARAIVAKAAGVEPEQVRIDIDFNPR